MVSFLSKVKVLNWLFSEISFSVSQYIHANRIQCGCEYARKSNKNKACHSNCQVSGMCVVYYGFDLQFPKLYSIGLAFNYQLQANIDSAAMDMRLVAIQGTECFGVQRAN